ncbi:chloride channel CLIC-like protein 1 [Sphaeramia orbicularis]|uniref:chloride channel CLIC-like protein 1 n=1 Tax=Sphaeramia orbicularis TaxID=375764 RepID=UPI0011812157|nr:chloride channel CLIC-like protein 1 [Sphaeramia orbicularis]
MSVFEVNCGRMLVSVLVLASVFTTVTGTVTRQQVDDEWVDPYDMLNYDPSTRAMRTSAEPNNYPNVPSKREDTGSCSLAELTLCKKHAEKLQKQNEEQQQKISTTSMQPTFHPVFERFLRRLLREMETVGLPSDSADAYYDATIKVSKQTMTELWTVLEDKEIRTSGPLDEALSEILVDLPQQDCRAGEGWFKDTVGVDVDTVLKMLLCVLLIVAIIYTPLWSTVSWFCQFRRLFTLSFCISIGWNWLYLYKIAFAEHQNNIVKMNTLYAQCSGVKTFNWIDSLEEWFRSTWTLQDDPCKEYYKVLIVDPVLLVPPNKAISMTITAFITDPLKHIGQGIREFLRALLQDLPVQLQIPVFFAVVLSVLVVMYAGVMAAFQYGITAPFRTPPPTASTVASTPEVQRRRQLSGRRYTMKWPKKSGACFTKLGKGIKSKSIDL